MLSDRYRSKIKTAAELLAIVGPRPRSRRVIMCHGVFDIVHPGHLRHLIYAKSKADILIASLTADRFVLKGPYRPHVSQDLRAINLAAYEIVDYVLIDECETPIENIRLLQPDLFAKGFEYAIGSSRTSAEQEALSSYGGELILTPGDVVYSSSRLLAHSAPDIRYANLQMLMEANRLSFATLRESLKALSGYNVHVLGDCIVDTLTHCTMIGGQTKTPTLSAALSTLTHYVGGAGVIAKHLRAAGADVTLLTVLGDDPLGRFAVEDLRRAKVKCSPVIDTTRPTVEKNAFVVDGYRLLKVDTVDNRSITDDAVERLIDGMSGTPNAIVCADFRHGIFNKRTIPKFINSLAFDSALLCADSQVASRWGNVTDFKNFDMLTPNEREARFALGDQDSGVRPLAAALAKKAGAQLVFLKLGPRGLLACRGEHYFVVPSFADNVIDTVGAGDAFLAYATLAMLAHGNDAIAAILGSVAAACECSYDGNVPITPDDMLGKINSIEQQMEG